MTDDTDPCEDDVLFLTKEGEKALLGSDFVERRDAALAAFVDVVMLLSGPNKSLELEDDEK